MLKMEAFFTIIMHGMLRDLTNRVNVAFRIISAGHYYNCFQYDQHTIAQTTTYAGSMLNKFLKNL